MYCLILGMYKFWKKILVVNQTKILISVIKKITISKLSFMFRLKVFINIFNKQNYYLKNTVRKDVSFINFMHL